MTQGGMGAVGNAGRFYKTRAAPFTGGMTKSGLTEACWSTRPEPSSVLGKMAEKFARELWKPNDYEGRSHIKHSTAYPGSMKPWNVWFLDILGLELQGLGGGGGWPHCQGDCQGRV